MSVKSTCEEEKKWFEKALIWPKEEKKKSRRVIEVGGCLHLITDHGSRNNAQATGRCILRQPIMSLTTFHDTSL